MFAGIKYLLSCCWKFNPKYIILLVFRQVASVLSVYIGLIMPQYILDSVFIYKNADMSWKYVIAFISISIVISIYSHLILNIISVERMKTFRKFQLYLGKKMMSARFEDIESEEFLNLKTKAEKFLYGNGNGFASVLENAIDLFGKLFSLMTISSIITSLNSKLILILLIIVVLSSAITGLNQKANIKINLEKAVQERRSSYFSNLFQDFRFGKEIRVYNLVSWLSDKYKSQLDKMMVFYKKMANVNILYGLLNLLVANFQLVVSYIYVINEAFKGVITVGEFTKYLSSINLFSSTLKDIINGLINLQQYTDYYKAYDQYIKIEDIFSDDGKIIKDELCSTEIMDIEFVHVYFKYQSQENYSLQDISIRFSGLEKIAIVGENGAGKSTFIKLLLRIYKPTRGKILLNGIDIQSINYDLYIKNFSTVFQDFKLFSFTVEENIMFGNKNYTSVERALEQTGLLNKIMSLPQKENTYIYKDFDKRGFTPSGGEEQKIAMARAVCQECAKVILLDEPTSALDPMAEIEVYNQFNVLYNSRMCFYISHRLACTQYCSRIIVFNEGKIVEDGSQENLLKLGGEFKRMYEMQKKMYK